MTEPRNSFEGVLHVDVDGLTRDQVLVAVRAASAVFSAGDAHPQRCAAAWFKVDSPANEDLTAEESRLASLWEDANVAAAATFRDIDADDIWVLELVGDR